jgi:Tol biopolymer transport system component
MTCVNGAWKPERTVFLVVGVLVGLSGIGRAHAQEWSVPENLGPVVNSAFNEDSPHISKDGLSLYFISNRPARSIGSLDIWVSQRRTLNDPWGTPMNLGPDINTSSNERGPALSHDGHFLFFSSDRPGGFGSQDLWMSYRKHTHDDFGWQPPVNLGTGINTADPDFGAVFLESDDTGTPSLFFGRRESFGDADIYMSELLADGSWGPGVVITALSTPFDDLHPTVRPNGLELLFNSDRPGSQAHDLWVSTRQTVFAPWSTPVNVGPELNTEFNEQFPALSSDGATLIFASNRPGGEGQTDLYVSSREKHD